MKELLGLTLTLAVTLLATAGQPTSTELIRCSGTNPSIYGGSLAFQATVSPAPASGETITFQDGATTLGTGITDGGVAAFAISTLSVGPHIISAVYGGNADYDGSTSSPTNQTINKATVILTAPEAGTIPFGLPLSASVLTGGAATNAANNCPVAGSFAFTTPGLVANVGTTNVSVTFTPVDTASFNNATTTVSVITFFATNVFYVATTGNNSNPGTNWNAPWKTVGKATTDLVAGQTAYIRGGTYYETDLKVERSGSPGSYITLAAYPGEQPVIDGTGTSNARILDLNGQSHVQVSGLCLQNAFQGIVNGVRRANPPMSSQVLILSNAFYNLESVAMELHYCSFSTVMGNLASNTVSSSWGECISFSQCEYVDIAFNEVKNSTTSTKGGEGIGMKGSKHMRIYGNVIHDLNPLKRPGIYLDAYDGLNYDLQVFNNTVYNCWHGILVSSELGNRVEKASIYNNLIYDCKNVNLGIVGFESGLYPLNDVTFENNTVCQTAQTDNPQALSFNNPLATNVVVRNNIIYNYRSDRLVVVGSGTSNILQSYNLAANGTTAKLGPGSVFADPQFVNPSSRNYSLLASSPAINAGATNGLTFDLDQFNRPMGGRCDMGAYEYGATTTMPLPAQTKPAFIRFTNAVNQSSGDGHELTGVVNLNSSGIVIGFTNSVGSTNRTIAAVRFSNVNIPQGAIILNCTVGFELNQDWSPSQIVKAAIQINAENAGNSLPLTTTAANISSRSQTSNTAYWLPQWGNAGDAKTTCALDFLISEVVSRADWTNGNALTFLFRYNNTDSIVFKSYDSGAGNAPKLLVEYIMAPVIPSLSIQVLGNQMEASWSPPASGTVKLLTGPTVISITNEIIGAMSPYTNAIIGAAQFFRMQWVRP